MLLLGLRNLYLNRIIEILSISGHSSLVSCVCRSTLEHEVSNRLVLDLREMHHILRLSLEHHWLMLHCAVQAL